MANITKRKNKDGEVTSYKIQVSYAKTWKPDPSCKLTEHQMDIEAQRQAVIFEEQCKNGLSEEAMEMTLSEFIPIYLEHKKIVVSPYTYTNYKRIIETIIIPRLGHFKICEIRQYHVQELFIDNLARSKKLKRNGSESDELLMPSSIRRYLTVLQSIFKFAIRRQIISKNPAKAELLDIPRAMSPKIDFFTKQEAVKILNALHGEPLQFQVLIQLAIITGARRGELTALKFSDVNKETKKITIQRAAVKVPGEGLMVKPPKDYEVRTIAVTSDIIKLITLLEHQRAYEARLKTLYAEWHEGDWIFTQKNGEMMNHQTPTKQLSKFLARHNFRHVKFHSLRHTSATLLLYSGVSIRQVQGRLGHGDIDTTNKYLHFISDADEEAANLLESMLKFSGGDD